MKNNTPAFILILFTLLLLAGCGGTDTDPAAFKGQSYPPTTRIEYIFQAGQAPPGCRVFAELLVTLPAGLHGKIIQEKFENEAKARGTDVVLLGQSRQMKDDEGLTFIYYGPEKEYLCNDKWCGWKYGYDVWEEQGDFVSIGFKEWGNQNVQFDFPVMLEAAFLRCQ
jgi:hypothetical protein